MSHFCNGALLWILCPCPVPEEHPTEASTPDATFVTDVRSANMIPCLQRSNSNLINSVRTPFARRNFRIFVLRRCVIWYLAWGGRTAQEASGDPALALARARNHELAPRQSFHAASSSAEAVAMSPRSAWQRHLANNRRMPQYSGTGWMPRNNTRGEISSEGHLRRTDHEDARSPPAEQACVDVALFSFEVPLRRSKHAHVRKSLAFPCKEYHPATHLECPRN